MWADHKSFKYTYLIITTNLWRIYIAAKRNNILDMDGLYVSRKFYVKNNMKNKTGS